MKHHAILIKNDSKNWLLFLVTGSIFIVAGLYSLFFPFSGTITVTHIITLFALLTGISRIALAVELKKHSAAWNRQLFIAFTDVFAAVMLLFFGGITNVVLPFLLSFWIIAGFITLLQEASDISPFHASEAEWLAGGAMLSLASAFIVLYFPVLGVLTTIFWSVLSFIVTGVFYVVLSFRLRKMKKVFHL